MRSLVCDRPGQLSLVDRPDPVRGPDEVLVRIRRVGVCGPHREDPGQDREVLRGLAVAEFLRWLGRPA